MILVILVPPRQRHALRPILRLPRDARYVGEVSPPLPALHPVRPLRPHSHPGAVHRVVLRCYWPEVVRGNGDEDAAAARVGEARLLGTLGRESLREENWFLGSGRG